MKQLHGNNIILGTAATIVLIAQPVWAQTAQITGINLKPVDNGVSLKLKTSSSKRPQVFTTKRGNVLVADIINSQLKLPEGNSFTQENPAPGIALVTINQLDANSIRILVTGTENVPNSLPVTRKQDGITLNFGASSASTSTAVPSAPSANPSPITNNTPAPPSPSSTAPAPKPQVDINTTPAQAAGPGQPSTPAPPFLPRAVAPPVGDIAISNIDASPSTIDLGTQERVPRLVLRDAPVREVLSLLARAAGMNLAYTTAGDPNQNTSSSQDSSGEGPTISLDIENEPVQDVFNYVLRLSNLEANRSGRTIFVGPNLPNSTRDVVMRNMRLNQVSVDVALNFLVGMGAESAVSRERQVTSVSAVPVGSGATPITQTQTTTETKVERLSLADSEHTSPILRGLQALGDERTNSVTLIGSPRLIEMAMGQLTQLDIRRRQVVVNVKVIDVNLSNIKDFNSSFSFGVGNNFFSNDGGAATVNFGGSRPASKTEVSTSVTSQPVISNPITGEPFFDQNGTFTVPNGGTGLRVVDDGLLRQNTPGDATFLNPRTPLGANGDPTAPGLSGFEPGTPDTVTITTDPDTGRREASFAEGTRATAEFGLPSLFRFPKRFLASLQAQVQSGNAKVLTDPTLIVQEGQTANVNLTQEVIGNIKREIVRDENIATETISADKESVGLTLAVKVDRIDDNGFISLSVAPTVKAPQSPAQIDVGSGGSQQIFLVSERSLQSGLVRLRDGQTLILSGIIQDQDRTSVSKVPILGDIPLLGSLFRKTNKTNERNEVIVMLTPQVMDDSQNSSFGYNYKPSPSVRQMLERRGLKFPRRK